MSDLEREKKNNSFESKSVDDTQLQIEYSEEDTSFDSSEDYISHFNPKDINIIVQPITIGHIVNRLQHNEIDLNTEFQRKGNLWKPDAQSRLIESIMLRFPLPAFYFDAENYDNWLIVDGLQRIWAIKNFIVNAEINDLNSPPLELRGLEIFTEYNNRGVTFDKLNRMLQRRILESPITTYLIQPGTPKLVKYNIFKRINTGGLGLNSMEIRHALYQGNATKFLRDLSEDPKLKELIKIPDKRMEDRELFLRAIAFINRSYLEYQNPLSVFLNYTMEDLNNSSTSKLKQLKENILNAISFQSELFGKDIFSKSITYTGLHIKINSALFEVWVSITSKLNDAELNNLINNKGELIEEYKSALLSDDLYNSITVSTSGKKSVWTRFKIIDGIINKYAK